MPHTGDAIKLLCLHLMLNNGRNNQIYDIFNRLFDDKDSKPAVTDSSIHHSWQQKQAVNATCANKIIMFLSESVRH